MRIHAALLSAFLSATFAASLACERPPIVGPKGELIAPEGRFGPVDFRAFIQDRPAVGGDWYLYQEEAGHLLSPFDLAYVIRDGGETSTRFAAVRVLSYYDPNTADSGTFTLSYSIFDEGTWSAEREWFTGVNIKDEGAFCADVFLESQVACDGTAWQLMLRAYPFLALEGPITVNRPGLFFRSAEGLDAGEVHVATLDETDLLQLPDPTTLDDLEDSVAPDWERLTWDFSSFAVDLPQAGMTLGSRVFGGGFEDLGDVFFLVSRRSVARFTLAPTLEGDRGAGVTVNFSAVDFDSSDNSIPDTFPAPSATTIESPAEGETLYLKLDGDSGEVEIADADAATPPHLPPQENRWDLGLRRTTSGNLRVLVSPGAAIYNATQRDGLTELETAMPPK